MSALNAQIAPRTTGFEILDIRAGEDHGVPYLIQQMFPSPFAGVGKALSIYGSALAWIRKTVFPTLIKLLHFNNADKKQQRLQFLEEDDVRFAAAILFLSRKPKI
ncbi:MAG: hypothetical protein HOP23_03155 [Methylococcaceae bacterium]|nr:hypothetical protein [Methylococcaceae bacterium]